MPHIHIQFHDLKKSIGCVSDRNELLLQITEKECVVYQVKHFREKLDELP